MVYLDYSATYPYVKYPSSAYGPFLNPNANYAYKEKHLLAEAENRVKKALGVKSGKVAFGGTSSQLIENFVMAVRLKTDMDSRADYQFYYSQYEHDSVERFNDWGSFYVNNFDDIIQEAEECEEECVTPFVFWQGVSNITGEIFPVRDIGRLCHKYNAFYICDATALLGHVAIEPNIDDWCDLLVLDGHKVGTELGIGCCWVSDRLDKWLDGFKLHGTPNLAGALAMAQAVEDACDKDAIEKRNEQWFYLFKGLALSLLNNDIRWTGVDRREWETGTWAINAIRLPGFNADALQQFLASKQVYISVGGSACAERHDYHVLENGYNLTKQEASEVIRVSFGENSTVEEVKALVEQIKNFKELYLK